MHEPTLQIPGHDAAAGHREDAPAAAVRSGEPFAGRYDIRSRLGVGGMAEVWLARDTALGRLVALKLLAPALASDPAFVERFRREATAIAALNHPNVVVIYDSGVAAGQPYIAMEYVAGRTLKEIVSVAAPLAPADAIAYALQMLEGLAAAHAVGIVHRDVKPQNLIARDDGTLKVADFGVARSADETMLTQYGAVIGTADYISPEQARGELATPASDLYSAGVVLFELLTGRLPFTGELPVAVANQHVRTPPPSLLDLDPAIPVALARVVDRALAKQPAERFGTAAEMRAALGAAAGGRSEPTRVMPPAPDATRVLPRTPPTAPGDAPRSRRGRLVAALALAALLVGVAFVLATRGGSGAGTRVLPRVVGEPVAKAEAALRTRGFAVRTGASVHSSEPRGMVAAVHPSGPSAPVGATVTLVASSGPRRIAIPAVTGFSQAAAAAALERLGLVVEPNMAYASAPSGTVVATTPPSGTPVAPRSAVALVVSAGPAPAAPARLPPGQAKKGPGKGPGRGPGKGHEKPKHKGAP